MYLPASLVVVVRGIFVAVSVRVTVAPTAPAPDWSVAVPEIVPLDTACPITAVEEKKHKAKRQQRATTTRLLNIQLPPGWAMPGPTELCTPRPEDCRDPRDEQSWTTP